MRADFAVVLDACVLAEAAVSDLFLRLSEEPRLLLPRWSEQIWLETERTYVQKHGWPPEIARSRVSAAKSAFPEAMVVEFEHLIEECENHPKDRHVLAAAIHANVDTIVTFNVKDYPSASLDRWQIEAAHPGSYLRVLYDHDPAVVTSVLHQMATRAKRSMPEMLARLHWSVPQFVMHVAQAQAIEVPVMPPQIWRR